MDRLNNVLSVLRTNPYVSSSVSLFLVLYAGLAAPALPASIAGLFEHGVFKMLILVLVLVLLKGQNVTQALLVAIGFVVSMSTLSRYRVYTMANELVSSHPVTNVTEEPEQAPAPESKLGPSFGPDSQPEQGSVDVSTWSSKDGVNRLSLRGYEYAGHDEPNHLPGGHGNSELQVADDNSGDQDPMGYEGQSFATIGGETESV